MMRGIRSPESWPSKLAKLEVEGVRFGVENPISVSGVPKLHRPELDSGGIEDEKSLRETG